MKRMTDVEVWIDMLNGLHRWTHGALEDEPAAALVWQPDEEANSIIVTLWHVSRALDLLKVRLLEGRAAEEELWFSSGWAARTGYDPRGLGWSGMGNLAGYTQQEVAAVPLLPLKELLDYFDQACAALSTCLAELPAEQLYGPLVDFPGEPPRCAMVRNFLMDGLGHLGEMRAILAMWERKQRTAG